MSWKGVAAAAALVAVAAIVWSVGGENGLSGGAEESARLPVHGALPGPEGAGAGPVEVADVGSARVDASKEEPTAAPEAPSAPGVWPVGRISCDGLET